MTSSTSGLQLGPALCLMFILLVPLAIAGLALINTGLGRSRSAAHAITSSLCVICIAVLTYFVFGFAIQGERQIASLPIVSLHPAALFLRGVDWGSRQSLSILLGAFSVALAALIPIGAAADRWRLGAACASTVLLAGFTLPLFVRLVTTFDTRTALTEHLLDPGGSGIQATGGLTALSIVWLLGARRGKYASNGLPAAIPAHNGVFVLFGCMLAWTGWIGLNAAGALLYTGLETAQSVLVALNTTFAAAAAALAAGLVTRIRFRRPDASLIANGWMAGLVASSGGCTLKPATAVITGLIAGGLVVLSVEFLEFTLKVDDPCGSISAHAIAGIWGLLAAGILAGSRITSHLVAIATLLGFILPLSYAMNWLLGRAISHRVSIDGERQGLDLHELGADAYPEFVVHSDEFIQR